MKERLRRALPVLGPLLVGALAYLLLGAGPRSGPTRDTVPSAWALPAGSAPDLAAAETVWKDRTPWGNAAGSDAGAEANNVVPVGVVAGRDGLEALFALPGAPLIRAREGDDLPGGGRVTGITPTQVSWTDSEGKTLRRELFVDPDPRPSASAAPEQNQRTSVNPLSQGQTQ